MKNQKQKQKNKKVLKTIIIVVRTFDFKKRLLLRMQNCMFSMVDDDSHTSHVIIIISLHTKNIIYRNTEFRTT